MKPEEVTRQDVENFLSGRDMMAARKVDAICQAVREDPHQQRRVAAMFNRATDSIEAGMTSNEYMTALTKTLKNPEYRDIKERMIETSRLINKATEGFLENGDLAEAMEDNPRVDRYGSPTLFAQMKPEQAELLVCDPNFMDPLAKLSNVRPIDPNHLKKFNAAVATEADRMYKMDDADVVAEARKLEDFGQELFKRFSAPTPGK